MQEFGNGWDTNSTDGWGSVPTDAANANDFGDTNPPTPTMSGRGRGGSFGGRGGFGSNYNTDNSNSNVNNDMNTSSSGGLRGGRGGGRGGFQCLLLCSTLKLEITFRCPRRIHRHKRSKSDSIICLKPWTWWRCIWRTW